MSLLLHVQTPRRRHQSPRGFGHPADVVKYPFINDEYDEEVRAQITEDGGTYLLDGMLAVRDANQHLGLELPEEEGYTTIAGFLMAQAGRVLKPGDSVKDGGGVFTVERVDRLRIRRVRFTHTPDDAPETRQILAALLPFVGTA